MGTREVGHLVLAELTSHRWEDLPGRDQDKAVQPYRPDDKAAYAEVGRDLVGISGETIRNGVRQALRDGGRLDDGELTSMRKPA